MNPPRRASAVPGVRAGLAPPARQDAPSAPAAAPPQTSPAERAPASRRPAPASRASPPPRPPKPVRYTLDLSQDVHKFLRIFAAEAEVDASVIMRALLAELRQDERLAERVRARAWAQ
jgi:hypothetical protein